MKTKEELLAAPMPERTCTRCGSTTTRYMVTSLDGKCCECSQCLAARERQDAIELERMRNPDEGNRAHGQRKKPLSYEWTPMYD